MTDVTTDSTHGSGTRAAGRLRRAGVVLVAAGAALAVWAAARAGGVELAVRGGGSVRQVGPAAVIATGLLAGLGGWGLLALLERAVRRPAKVWRTVAVVVFAVSLAGPLGGAGTGAKLALAGMHPAVATVLVAGLPGPDRPARTLEARRAP